MNIKNGIYCYKDKETGKIVYVGKDKNGKQTFNIYDKNNSPLLCRYDRSYLEKLVDLLNSDEKEGLKIINTLKEFKYEVLEYMTSNNKKIFTILDKKGYKIVSSIDKEFIFFVCNLLNKEEGKWLIKEDKKYRLNNKRIIKDLYNHRCVFYLP